LSPALPIVFFLHVCLPLPHHTPLEHQYNQGWVDYLDDEPSSFENLRLVWERDSGSFPTWLNGSYVKNGPARRGFGDGRTYSSYMDSWGKLHKFTFKEGEVSFSGRMLETANYNKSVTAGKMVPTITIAHVEPNDWSMEEMVVGTMNFYDNTNVWLWKLGPEDAEEGQYLAVTDWPQVHEVDPHTLAIKAKYGLSLTEGVSMASSTHWRREVGKDTSLQYHMLYNPITNKIDFTLFRFGSTWQDREVVGKFPLPFASVIHMFSVTENFAVVAVYPVSFDFMAMPTHNMHAFETLVKKDAPTNFFLINLNDGSVIDGFESDNPFLVFSAHHVNAWEEGSEVVLDLACSPWDTFTTIFDMGHMLNQTLTDRDTSDNVIKRVRLDLNEKSVIVEDWPNALGIPMLTTMEFPMINMAYAGRKNRFAYGWVSIDYWRNTLVKKDLENSMNDKMWSENSHYPGEMFFVPRPGAVEEDDGVLMTVVFDGEQRRSYLLLLDGKTFTEVDRSYLPFRIPFSFHGNWFPALH